jgi:diadenosine tetraphosphatase ApaH/serine/threonine PP2A family protein phosphatase
MPGESGPAGIVDHILTSQISGPVTHRGKLRPVDVEALIDDATTLLSSEPAVLQLSGEFCVVGDIHGNIDALIRIFESRGYPPACSYLFLGDYIDRGLFSCEVILLLYSLKLLYPHHIQLIRGNHEFALMTEIYGFKRECESRLTPTIYTKILRSFDHLPIAAILGSNFCVHGGISPSIKSITDIMSITKMGPDEPLGSNVVSDLVWSDPRPDVAEFEKSPRGCGVLYGAEAVANFSRETRGLNRIIRAHESCSAGYDWPFIDNGSVLTIFSSCDYCEMGNDGAVVVVKDSDEDPSCTQVRPLSKSDISKRRLVLPLWLLESPMQMMEKLDDELDLASALSQVIQI